MEQIEKNTVSAEKQLSVKVPVFYENREGTGKKILFVGNSITMHGYKPDIGWYGENYGMAASAKERDYVHLVMQEIHKRDEEAGCCILQVAGWERDYRNGQEIMKKYEEARAYNADIIIMRAVENCSRDGFDADIFAKEYKALIDFLNASGNAEIIITTSFWKHIADDTILQIAQEREYKRIYMGDLGEDDAMKAIGKFEHEGVANHPGDLGMEMIAKRILQEINIC